MRSFTYAVAKEKAIRVELQKERRRPHRFLLLATGFFRVMCGQKLKCKTVVSLSLNFLPHFVCFSFILATIFLLLLPYKLEIIFHYLKGISKQAKHIRIGVNVGF